MRNALFLMSSHNWDQAKIITPSMKLSAGLEAHNLVVIALNLQAAVNSPANACANRFFPCASLAHKPQQLWLLLCRFRHCHQQIAGKCNSSRCRAHP